jgi:ferrous iron transport protein B
MSKPRTEIKPLTVAVLGNPNTGKSTLFNALTGIHQHTGNYPGVTVEKRTGHFDFQGTTIELVDLPGTYSLAPHSPDELVSVNVLLGRPPASEIPDVILCVIDGSNLQRNLFLVSQILDLHRPTVVAVNMIDIAKRHGMNVDFDRLSDLLGVPVVGIQARKREGLDELKAAVVAANGNSPAIAHDPFSSRVNASLSRLEANWPAGQAINRFALTRMLFDADGLMASQLTGKQWSPLLETLREEKDRLSEDFGETTAECESEARYQWIHRHLGECTEQSSSVSVHRSLTDRVDVWLTHPLWGLFVALVVLVALFQLVFWAADPASQLIDQLNLWGAQAVNSVIPAGALNSLLIDGLINGVGSVLIFLPQILLLFLILAVLEDTGYLARAAFLMDKYLSKLGISGISLFPLLSSFACAVPGIMATRVINDPRERLITILVAPLMSCSARLPVYVLMIAAFVPNHKFLGGLVGLRGLIMLAMYLIGVMAAIGVAWILKKTILRTGSSSFVLELPTYKLPGIHNVLRRMFDGGWSFVRDAGTLIVVMTILVWAAGYFPRNSENLPAELVEARRSAETQREALPSEAPREICVALEQEQAKIDNRIGAFQLRNSYLGKAGQLVEPIVKPLGWDWRIGSAAIASFPAREVVISTMGVIFGLGSDTDEESTSLRTTLENAKWEGTDRKLFTLPVALSVMVFFALCAQCVSTLAAIRRETNSYRWPLFTFAYMTVLAYVAALITFQVFDRVV